MSDSAPKLLAEVTVGRPLSRRRQVLSAFRAQSIDPRKLIVSFRGLAKNIPANPFRKSSKITTRQLPPQPGQVRHPPVNSAALLARNVHAQLPIMNRIPSLVDLTVDSDSEDVNVTEDYRIIDVDSPSPPGIPQYRPERPPWAQLPNEAMVDGPQNQIYALPSPRIQEENNQYVNNLRDADLARALQQQFDSDGPDLNHLDLDVSPAPIENQKNPVMDPWAEPAQERQPQIQTLEECQLTLLVLFPDICQDHVLDIYQKISQNSDQLISHILDRIEKGTPYPKTKKEDNNLKRKRAVSQDEAAALKYGAEDRPPLPVIGCMSITIRSILSNEFPSVPMQFIDAKLSQNQHRLFHTYRHLDEVTREYKLNDPPTFQKLKKPRPSKAYAPARVQEFLDSPANITKNPGIAEAYRELQVCRRHHEKAQAARTAERQHLLEETENERRAQADGTMSECGCCFGDFPLNRMIHCNAQTLHFFCKACARQTAETEIGNSKYEIHCMSMDGCSGGFGNDQRSQFLNEKIIIALERNEQEAMLRMAGIENLASCPFCPFAAEYPPVKVDKEFRCQAPDCEKVSCRLCNLESHIPKSCAEFAKENGLSIRRQIEEAMSAAMIRKCNKCGTPFIKEEGCNKMTCTRNGCRNIQCYVCSKSCGYEHFNDKSRGGKDGNCPLFESAEDRHKQEVAKAEKEALAKARAEHPEYTDEDLKIKVSESVLKDEEKRKARDPAVMVADAHANELNARARANELNAHIVNYDLPPFMPMRADIAHPLMDFAQNNVLPELWPGDQGWKNFPDLPARLPTPRYPHRPPGHNVAWPLEGFRPRQTYVPLREDPAANPPVLDRQANRLAKQKALVDRIATFERAAILPDVDIAQVLNGQFTQGDIDAQFKAPKGSPDPQRVRAHPLGQVMKIEGRAARRFENAGLEPPGNLFGTGRRAVDDVLPGDLPPPEDYFIHQPAHLLAPVKKENKYGVPLVSMFDEYPRHDAGPRRQIPYNAFIEPHGDIFGDDYSPYLQPLPFVPTNANDVKAKNHPVAKPANAINKQAANALKKVISPPVGLPEMQRLAAHLNAKQTPHQRMARCLVGQQSQLGRQGGAQGRVPQEELWPGLEAQGHMPGSAPRILDHNYDDEMPNFSLDNFMPDLYDD